MHIRTPYPFKETIRNCRQALRGARRQLAAMHQAPPAGAWLIDHYSFLSDQAREVREALPPSAYRDLPRAGAKANRREPRIYVIASILANASRDELPVEQIRAYLDSFQRETPLTMAELWTLRPMLKLALLERIGRALARLDSADAEEHIRSSILSLKELETASWPDLVEAVSPLDLILREDPAGVYARMDFPTRDACRHAIENIARRSGNGEPCVAMMALELALDAAEVAGPRAREAHVGYYLIGPGLEQLQLEAGHRPGVREAARDALYRHANAFYLGGLAVVTAGLAALICRLVAPVPWWYAALLLIPASQAALLLVNRLVTLLIPPRRLPRLDFRDGIPEDCRTFVVVPTLLLSRANVARLLERLEIHYLANRDPNLCFALLTDDRDSASPEGDPALLGACADGIRSLNRRYGANGSAPFYLFHRPLAWNEQEGVWMGHERKRGKLNDFNALLTGGHDAFRTKVGDLSVLPGVRYVITLDSDTQLPRDAARELIATMAHPLNRAALDPATGTVREGYAVLQPRVSISMESAAQSRIAKFYSGQTGFDPYTTAVSDVYQDLYGRASFTGKGIYDVRAFHAAASGFPENRILSHDLIEGEYARVGLVTDIEVIDDFPSTYQSYSKRKHRWVRGDWQIASWILPRVPGGRGRRRNPLDALSRWKIADNLRRSLYEIALSALVIAGWAVFRGAQWRALAAALALLLLPAYADLLVAVLHLPPVRFWKTYIRETLYHFGQSHVDAFYVLVLALHQSFMMADAVARTLARLLVTRRKLLEWETMAQAEGKSGPRAGGTERYLFLAPLAAFAAAEWVRRCAGGVETSALALIEIWILSPLMLFWLNGVPFRAGRGGQEETAFLRGIALRTWRYFADLATPETHWLAPDNIQEDPPATANRTSPTNLGLQLDAQFAAHDFGYLTHQELTSRLRNLLRTFGLLPRCRGHFYNWYDTRTGMPLAPHYISTVDSGNLAASLLVAKQGCLALRDHPLIDGGTLAGLRDHCLRLREALPGPARTSTIMRLIAGLLRQLEDEPAGLFHWEGLLSGTASLVQRLNEPLQQVAARLGERYNMAEAFYWYDLLAARVDNVLRDLRALAPWLGEPFEPELRMWSNDRRTAALIDELCRIPRLSQLQAHYELIAGTVRGLPGNGTPLPASLRAVLEQLPAALEEAGARASALLSDFAAQAESACRFFEEMDFAFLFDRKRKLLHIGYDTAAQRVDKSYYDLLGSEARTGVFVAIAKGDLPREAWFHLGRKLTSHHGWRTLVSWSGTMFEYFMPALFMKTFGGTLVDQSLVGAIRIQQQYARERKVPWGISEAAYAARDHMHSYQYRAFGIPQIAADPKVTGEVVIAPYATILSAMVDLPAAAANLRRMADLGWTGWYGFYEAADYMRRPGAGAPPVVVRAFMAHHQGMALLSLNNTLLDGAIQERFHADPLVLAAEFLLQERSPALVPAPEQEEPQVVEVVASAGAALVEEMAP